MMRRPYGVDPVLALIAAIAASWVCLFIPLAVLASQSPAALA